MTQAEFNFLQTTALYALGPVIAWLLVALAALGILSAMFVIWLGMLYRITR